MNLSQYIGNLRGNLGLYGLIAILSCGGIFAQQDALHSSNDKMKKLSEHQSDVLSKLYSAKSDGDLGKAIERIPITKIVLVESRGDEVEKLCLNFNGKAYACHGNEGKFARVRLYDYAMVCLLISEMKLLQNDYSAIPIAMDDAKIELRVFFNDVQESVTFSKSSLPLAMWSVYNSLRAMDKAAAWESDKAIKIDSVKLWGSQSANKYNDSSIEEVKRMLE